MRIDTLVVGPLQVNCFIVSCPATGEAAVIDAGDEPERILHHLATAGLKVRWLLNTHGHFDHQGGIKALKDATGAPFVLHAADLPVLQRAVEHAAVFGLSTEQAPDPDQLLHGGETLPLGQLELQVLHTPGHSPGGVCYLGTGHLFSGDTLFAGSIGRTDLPLGSHDTLIDSIRRQLLVLPDDTVVHPGHGPDSTIGRERLINPFLSGNFID